MKSKKNLILVIIVLILAIPALFNGIGVLSGFRKFDITIIEWLVWYNIVFAAISLYAAYKIWKNSGLQIARFIFSGHIIVLGILFIILYTSGNVATKSLNIMGIRVVVWALILFFMKNR